MSSKKGSFPTEKEILKFMQQIGRPLLLKELYHFFHISSQNRKSFRRFIKKLVKQGKIIHIKGRRYGLPEQMQLLKGRLCIHRDGYGFVEPEDPSQQAIFVPPSKIKGAIDGDLVIVRIEKQGKKKREGSIIRILERPKKYIIGFFYQSKRFATVLPEDEHFPFEIFIPPEDTKNACTGEMVLVEILNFTPGRRIPQGRIVKVLGDPEDLNTQLKAVIYKYNLPHKWSPRLKKELKKIPEEIDASDLTCREDLTSLPFVTIDGEKARDFDDAVYVKKISKGFRLYVAIADVSHYVSQGSFLDQEAYQRGTSVYFPNAVVPMFPEKLSNHLCSLKPQVIRLVLTVILDFDRKGRCLKARFTEAFIKSRERLTYTQVKKLVIEKDPQLRKRYYRIIRSLDNALELARLLRKFRQKRGSIDFDLPEAEIILDTKGHPEEIVRAKRHFAHFMIEEFMIAANEAVARFLTQKAYPFLYRIHEEPDPIKLKKFIEFAHTLGISIEIPEKVSPSWFQKIIRQVEAKPYGYLINTLLLRSLKQAKYSPENIGHFGLASSCYCHFTSPIRRYPDLVVHRALKAALKKEKPPLSLEALEEIGKHLSERERLAMEAEREMLDRVRVRFMLDHIGEEFEGVISGVASFGFFVELLEIFVSGVVRLVDMPDDYYILDEKRYRLIGRRTGKIFQVGDLVKVRVKDVHISRRHINFELVEKLSHLSQRKEQNS